MCRVRLFDALMHHQPNGEIRKLLKKYGLNSSSGGA
jgi:hypothetical protein